MKKSSVRMAVSSGSGWMTKTTEDAMTEQIRLAMLIQCEAVDREARAYLDAHPDTPRYCYTCQVWLKNAAGEAAHHGHSSH